MSPISPLSPVLPIQLNSEHEESTSSTLQHPGSETESDDEDWPLHESTEELLFEVGNRDWRTFEPPPELTSFQTDTHQEIRKLLESSIKTIKETFLEEKRSRIRPPDAISITTDEEAARSPQSEVRQFTGDNLLHRTHSINYRLGNPK